MIAIPWYFVSTLKEAPLFGVISTAVAFVSLFWGLYSGSLIDRHNRKYIFLVVSSMACLIIGSIAGYGFWAGNISWWLVAIVFCATFLLYNIHYPNLYAFAQEITDPKDYGRITSYIEVQGQSTNAIAGAVGAILLAGTADNYLTLLGYRFPVGFSIEAWLLQEVFLLDACTYIVSIALIALIRFVPIAEREPDYRSVLNRIVSGFSFLKSNPVLFIFGNASYMVFITILVGGFYLLPVYIENHLHGGKDVYPSMEMYFALGSVMAGLFIRIVFKSFTTVKAIICLAALATVIYAVMLFDIPIMLFYVLALLLGLSNAGTRIMRMTYMFNHVPNDYIGRVNSVFNIFSVVSRITFLSLFSLPFFHFENNVVYAILIFATFTFTGTCLLMIFYRKIIGIKIRLT